MPPSLDRVPRGATVATPGNRWPLRTGSRPGSNTHITAARYAKWAEAEYRQPIRLRRGEVAADLLARLGDGARGQVLRRVK